MKLASMLSINGLEEKGKIHCKKATNWLHKAHFWAFFITDITFHNQTQ